MVSTLVNESKRRSAPANWRLALAAPLVCALVAGCGGGDDPTPRDVVLTPVAGDFRGPWPAQTYVAQTASEWAQVWATHTPWSIPSPPIPTVDFSSSTLVGVALGLRPSGCYSMQLAGATEDASEVVVQYRELVPPPGLGCTGDIVYPVQFATIPKTAKPVRFLPVS